MSKIVRVLGQGLVLNIIVRVFGQRLFHENNGASIWPDTLL